MKALDTGVERVSNLARSTLARPSNVRGLRPLQFGGGSLLQGLALAQHHYGRGESQWKEREREIHYVHSASLAYGDGILFHV